MGIEGGFFRSIEGVLDSHLEASSGVSGVSVFLFPGGASAAAEVRGFAAGTRQFDSLAITHTVDKIHGVVFSGGSVYGHSAAQGVVRVLGESGVGIMTEHGCVPVVPSAVIYDLGLGGGISVDYFKLGKEAATLALGGGGEISSGAGAGATVGKLLGLARATKTTAGCSIARKDVGTFGAFIVPNCFGEVRSREGKILAGIRGEGTFLATSDLFRDGEDRVPFGEGDNTTLTLLMTDVELSRKELYYISVQANNFLSSIVRPYGTIYDGDVTVAVSTTVKENPSSVHKVVSIFEELLYDALLKSVREASGIGGIPSARECVLWEVTDGTD